jgi:hypothetical protein
VLELPPELKFPQDFEMVFMSSIAGGSPEDRKKAKDGHRDLSNQPSHGVCLRRKGAPAMAVAICSDTPPPPPKGAPDRRKEWKRTWGPALAASVLVAHLGSVPLTELRRMDDFEGEGLPDDSKRELAEEAAKLTKLREQLEEACPDLQGQIEYAQWLRSHLPDREREKELVAEIVGSVPENWLPPPEHNYLAGLLQWARAYRKKQHRCESGDAGRSPQRLFVIGELSEELGTMRGKVATRLNNRIFGVDTDPAIRRQEPGRSYSPYALTADIGLHACLSEGDDGPRVEVLCTTCNLDTDRTSRESYHTCHDVCEVCVKGENEGIFYNCLEHDPALQDEPAFLEQLERFDIFGR